MKLLNEYSSSLALLQVNQKKKLVIGSPIIIQIDSGCGQSNYVRQKRQNKKVYTAVQALLLLFFLCVCVFFVVVVCLFFWCFFLFALLYYFSPGKIPPLQFEVNQIPSSLDYNCFWYTHPTIHTVYHKIYAHGCHATEHITPACLRSRGVIIYSCLTMPYL